jgi:hypothetical protein
MCYKTFTLYRNIKARDLLFFTGLSISSALCYLQSTALYPLKGQTYPLQRQTYPLKGQTYPLKGQTCIPVFKGQPLQDIFQSGCAYLAKIP